MGLNKWKEIARQAYRDQQLQDNEGGCGEPVGFVTGFIEACKQRQSEIERLERELKEAVELFKEQLGDMKNKSFLNDEKWKWLESSEKYFQDKDKE